MSVIVACPSCGAKLKPGPQFIGKSIRCPRCQHMFLNEMAPPRQLAELQMAFAWIPPGQFLMGGTGNADEQPPRTVHITRGFWMGRTPVTQAQWQGVMGFNPAHFAQVEGAPDCPIESVSWNECQSFCARLSELAKTELKGKSIRLPTEAEWEYACRAGTTGDYYSGSSENALKQVGWYTGNSGNTTKPVRGLLPNAWGLYDMHGNVWECCQDYFGKYEARDAQKDPTGPTNGSYRICRGGAWNHKAAELRAAHRHYIAPSGTFPSLGLRVCWTPD